jgi:23S rRNA pseudouridine1911/1915/1917 synthase
VVLFPVLYEDAELLVLHKPAGLVCHPTKAGPLSSLVSRVRIYLGGTGEPQMVHRLDRETSGVMVFGKAAMPAEALRHLWLGGFVTKEYVALVHGHVRPAAGEIQAPLGRDEHSAVAIKDCVRADGAAARTRYRVERYFERLNRPYSRLRLWLDTGRKHQIRIHLAHFGHPLVGDKLYGGHENLYLKFVERRLSDADRKFLELPCQALHAEWLWLPWSGKEQGFNSAPEPWFADFEAGAPVVWPTGESDLADAH